MKLPRERYEISAETLDSMLALLVSQNRDLDLRSDLGMGYVIASSRKLADAFGISPSVRFAGLALFSKRIPQA